MSRVASRTRAKPTGSARAEALDTLLTVRDWLRYAVSEFQAAGLSFGHGSTNAYDEAAYLILHTLRLPLDRLEAFIDARLLIEERRALWALLTRRIEQRLPAAYLTHEAWLGEHSFYIDENVIVPRSFIAELLHEVLGPWVTNPEQVGSVLDLCTGSGCLAVLAALVFPNARVDASDLSAAALAVARRNVERYGLVERINLVRSDMFTSLAAHRYDIIISNPPYVNAAAMAALPQEYLREPRAALASGEDGLDHVRVILRAAGEYLAPNGLLIVETGDNRAALEAAFPKLAFTWLEVSGGDGLVFLLHRDDLKAGRGPARRRV